MSTQLTGVRRRIRGKKGQVTVWVENEGASTDHDEEVPAHQSLRGQAALVTVSCPRRYPLELADRKRLRQMIPADFCKDDMLQKLRRIVLTYSNVKLVKGTCHDEPHKRCNRKTNRRERHMHLPVLMSGTFAHKKVADAFYKEHGIRIWFSFRLKRFVSNLLYCMEPGKKASTDLDRDPAKFPADLNLEEELKAAKHPGDAPLKESKKRKRLSFDEASNIVLEGIGEGPLKTGKALEEAAKKLKQNGQVELWNYLGEMKRAQDVTELVSKVWRLNGQHAHPMWREKAKYDITKFKLEGLGAVKGWRKCAFAKRALVLSGDGGLGKTHLGEALAEEVSPSGYWFVDDPDDFRELEGLVQEGHAIVLDEITLANYSPNQVKKLLDIEKARRLKCRHFNGTKPKGCPLILCTNSDKDKFFPVVQDKNDRTGISRRHLFQTVAADVRRLPQRQPVATVAAPQPEWQSYLQGVCEKACVKESVTNILQAALDLGVATVSELGQHAAEIASLAALKPLERKRLLAVLMPPPDDHDDPFGHGGSMD